MTNTLGWDMIGAGKKKGVWIYGTSFVDSTILLFLLGLKERWLFVLRKGREIDQSLCQMNSREVCTPALEKSAGVFLLLVQLFSKSSKIKEILP